MVVYSYRFPHYMLYIHRLEHLFTALAWQCECEDVKGVMYICDMNLSDWETHMETLGVSFTHEALFEYLDASLQCGSRIQLRSSLNAIHLSVTYQFPESFPRSGTIELVPMHAPTDFMIQHMRHFLRQLHTERHHIVSMIKKHQNQDTLQIEAQKDDTHSQSIESRAPFVSLAMLRKKKRMGGAKLGQTKE